MDIKYVDKRPYAKNKNAYGCNAPPRENNAYDHAY